MTSEHTKFKQAFLVWVVFIVFNVLLNGTIPFVMGRDIEAWTSSPTKGVLFGLIQYGVMFLVIPLMLTKGWELIRQPSFFIPLTVALLALALRPYFRPVCAIVVFVLIWLHLRYDLSDLGFRSRGWAGDVLATFLIGLFYAFPALMATSSLSFALSGALTAWMARSFANPASTVENIFYFGFLTERLSLKIGKWLTPLLIGAMYVTHEMTNPEYWSKGMNFPMVFLGITFAAFMYLWRRSVVVIWLGDGLGRFLSGLF